MKHSRTEADPQQQRRRRRDHLRVPMLVLAVGLGLAAASVFGDDRAAVACGGLFCQNDPVDQVGERIVFAVNDDQTVTSLIEIQYMGSAEDFSWVLPVPTAIEAEDLAVPDEGEGVFDELHDLTDVRIIAPPRPPCTEPIDFGFSGDDDFATDASSDSEEGVEVFASGEVGPFGFDVIGSADPGALIRWLRDNNYRVEQSMEPLIDVYVQEEFAFVAMRLLDGEEAESIMPIEITYGGDKPMIPLRLTAVAAASEMPVFTWIFADEQAVPENYGHMEIATAELTFSDFGGNDYRSLVQRRADALDGQAFITEFAGPSNSLELSHPYLQDMARQHGYLTRLSTFISPEEMTVDPVFALDGDRADVSNVRDASELSGLYRCEREGAGFSLTSDAISPISDDGEVLALTPTSTLAGSGIRILVVLGLVVLAAVAAAFWLIKRDATQKTPQI